MERLSEDLEAAQDDAYQLQYEIEEMTAAGDELQQRLNAEVGRSLTHALTHSVPLTQSLAHWPVQVCVETMRWVHVGLSTLTLLDLLSEVCISDMFMS